MPDASNTELTPSPDELPDEVHSVGSEILSDSEFLTKVDAITKWVFKRYGSLSTYTWEDLRQDTLIKFAELLPLGGFLSNPAKVLMAIASNTLISEHRRQGVQSRDYVGRVESKELSATENDIQGHILIDELSKHLSEDENALYEDIISGKSLSEIASECGVSRQMMLVRFKRLLEKVRRFTQAELHETRSRSEQKQKEIARLRDETRSYIEDLQTR